MKTTGSRHPLEASAVRRCGQALLGAALLVSACTGQVGDRTSAMGDKEQTVPNVPKVQPAPIAVLDLVNHANLAPRLRLKAHREVFNTIKETFAYSVVDTTLLPPETMELASGFFNNSTSNRVGEAYFLGMSQLAEKIKDAIPTVTLLKFCTGANASGEPCARAAASGFAEQLTGKHMEAEQLDKLVAVYKANLAGASHEVAMRAIIQTLLQLPSFLYRTEFGVPAGDKGVRLTGPEVAAALSSLLWEAGPDERLRAAGAAGELATARGIEEQARRLLSDGKARGALFSFVTQWLGLRDLDRKIKDATLFPDYTPQRPAEFLRETEAFSENVLFEKGSSLRTLLTARTTRINGTLAKFYDLGGADGDTFVDVALPSKRAGILSQGSFLLAHSGEADTNPIRRGSFVQRQLLCGVIPDPPAGVENPEVKVNAETTIEDLYPQHRTPACKGCHVFMNPIGFGFEDLDAIGKLRTNDNGHPVKSSGYILNTATEEKREFGAGEVYQTIAELPETAACFTLRAYQYALGRVAGQQDAALLTSLSRTFRGNDLNVIDLFVNIVTSDAFVTRSPQ